METKVSFLSHIVIYIRPLCTALQDLETTRAFFCSTWSSLWFRDHFHKQLWHVYTQLCPNKIRETGKLLGKKIKIKNLYMGCLKKFYTFKNFHYWDKPQRKLWHSSLNSIYENFEFTHFLLKRKGWSIGLRGLSTNGFLFPAQDCYSSFIHSFIHHNSAVAQTDFVNKNSSPANSHHASNIKCQVYEHPAEKQSQIVHWYFFFLLSV